jgi:hypothetical protein
VVEPYYSGAGDTGDSNNYNCGVDTNRDGDGGERGYAPQQSAYSHQDEFTYSSQQLYVPCILG